MRQTLLFVLLVGLILATAIVWYVYIRQPANQTETVGTAGTTTGLAPQDSRLAQYNELKSLKPDLSILTNSLFQSLVRYRPANQAPTATPGRANPFVPF